MSNGSKRVVMLVLVFALGTLLPAVSAVPGDCGAGVCPMMGGAGPMSGHASPCHGLSFDRSDCCSVDSPPLAAGGDSGRELDRPSPFRSASPTDRVVPVAGPGSAEPPVGQHRRATGIPLFTLYASFLS